MDDNKELQIPVGRVETRTDKFVQKLDRDLIEAALKKAPSGNNAKPFVSSWSENVLTLTHSTENAEHYLNRGNSASLLALGCALASVQIAANAQGCMAQFTLPNFDTADWSVKIHFSELPRAIFQDLAAVISSRQTYRRQFRKSDISVETRVQLEEMKFENAALEIATDDELTPDFKKYMIATENNIWAHAKATKDFLKGVRFFSYKKQTETRGIASTNLGSNLFQVMFLRLANFVPALPSLLVKLPFVRDIFNANARRDFKNSHFLVVHATDLQEGSIVNAGYLAMNAWLTLEKNGYKAQPMSSSSLCLVDAAKGLLPADTTPEFLRLFNTVGPRVVDHQFQLTPPEQCVWILRFGKAQ